MQILAQLASPGHSRQRGPCLPAALFRGSGQGQRAGPWKALKVRVGTLGTCLGRLYCVCPARLVSWRQASADSVCYYCRGRTATLLLFRLCHTRVQPGQTLPDSMQPGQLNLCSTLSWGQLAGWAAKSIQSSMIHQIGVGICPERLDPAVAGLLTRGRHSRVEALRLETCCIPFRPKSLSCTIICQVRLSCPGGQHYLGIPVSRPCVVTWPRNCQTARLLEPQLQRSGRQSDNGNAVPEVALASRSGSRRLRPIVSSCHFSQHGIPRGTLAGSPAPSLALAYRPLVLPSTLPRLPTACIFRALAPLDSARRPLRRQRHWGHPCQILISAAVNDPQPTPPPA